MKPCPSCHRIPCSYPRCEHLARRDRRMCWTHAVEEDHPDVLQLEPCGCPVGRRHRCLLPDNPIATV